MMECKIVDNLLQVKEEGSIVCFCKIVDNVEVIYEKNYGNDQTF